MTEPELRRLLHQATEDLTASDDLRGRLSAQRHPRTVSGRKWWVAGLAAAAAVITLIAVPVLRPRSAGPLPATSSSSSLSSTLRPTSSVASAPPVPAPKSPIPSAADIQACEGFTEGGVPFDKTNRTLLCFFIRRFVTNDPTTLLDGADPTTLISGADPITLVIGIVDPEISTILGQGLGKSSSQLCLSRYGVWVVSGGNPRTQLQGCGDNTAWQRVIDDNAPHITWSVVNPAPLCGTPDNNNPRRAEPQPIPVVRMLVVCRSGNEATVLTGSAATAAEALAQLPSVGAPCTPSGWSLWPIQKLGAFQRDPATVKTATGCEIAPPLSALVDELNMPDPPEVPDVAGLTPQQALAKLQAARFRRDNARPTSATH